ncbi:hypothetical protein VSDKYIMU_CDS0080 [Enterococcus phage VRE9_4]
MFMYYKSAPHYRSLGLTLLYLIYIINIEF